MNNFILAITTYNRLRYLKDCISSWNSTRSKDVKWSLIIADDGSNDGTLEFLNLLSIKQVDIYIIKNKRVGVHQQVNTIFQFLEKFEFDFCFKVDDDISFKIKGWDMLYFKTAMDTGKHHLVFCDLEWEKAQHLQKPLYNTNLVGNIDLVNVHGFFYTISPEMVKTIGYFDVANFGFRGMGHVDYTARCARAGFTDFNTPWDIKYSNKYLTAFKKCYKSVLSNVQIAAYDDMHRKRKVKIIFTKDRKYIPFQTLNELIFADFNKELLLALTLKAENFEKEKIELQKWYLNELKKTEEWYLNKINKLPKWYISLGNKIFK